VSDAGDAGPARRDPMVLQLFRKNKELHFARSYPAPLSTVWDAWTRPEALRAWWGPDKTRVTDCEVDPRVGGGIRIVMEATEEMGRYQGTRWPMEGTFTLVEPHHHLAYDARSWTEGKAETTTIEHHNDLTLVADGDTTVVELRITISAIGSGAKMAAFGMKWGYKAQLDKLGTYLSP
jgi:uncharacterized protein YndB with AHSA1/START domain